jgi:hypothetical protein
MDLIGDESPACRCVLVKSNWDPENGPFLDDPGGEPHLVESRAISISLARRDESPVAANFCRNLLDLWEGECASVGVPYSSDEPAEVCWENCLLRKLCRTQDAA